MAKGAKPRLKVYRARLGFEDSVVAARNQGEALAAWGVRQNLFAEGQAAIETDCEAVAAALEHPGVPLRRPVGAKDAFGLDSRPPEALPPVKRPASARVRAEAKSAPEPKPTPDHSEVAAAEAELSRLEKDHRQDLDDLERRRKRLEEDAGDLERAWKRTRQAAERRIEQAMRAYRRAGG